MMDPPIYVGRRYLIAQEQDLRPYISDICEVLVDVANNSVLIDESTVSGGLKYRLYSVSGEVYDVAYRGMERYDVIDGTIIDCGMMRFPKVPRGGYPAYFAEVDHYGKMHHINVQALQRHIHRLDIRELYMTYRLGFVNGSVVYADGNTATIIDRDGHVRKMHFRSGTVWVYNGYIIHEREVLNMALVRVTAYDDVGQRCGSHGIKTLWGLKNRTYWVVTKRVWRLLIRISHMRRGRMMK